MQRFRPKLNYANVMSSIAVFGVLAGGGAYAAQKVGSNQIKPKAVKAKHVAKNAVRANHVAKNAVRARHVAKNAVRAAELANGAVTSGKIADGAVGSAKIGPSAVTGEKVAASTLSSGHVHPAFRTMWARVNADGTLAAHSGGITVDKGGAGIYTVVFPNSVNSRAVVANSTASLSAINVNVGPNDHSNPGFSVPVQVWNVLGPSPGLIDHTFTIAALSP